jgi:DNA polymerase V
MQLNLKSLAAQYTIQNMKPQPPFSVYRAVRGALLPIFMHEVPAGFPSPAEGYMEESLDLNEILVRHPAATFFVRVRGNSMSEANIFSGDVLVIDRSLEPKNRDIILAVLNGEFTVKRVLKRGKSLFLLPENPSYPPIEVQEGEEFQVWGVVTYVIHKAR